MKRRLIPWLILMVFMVMNSPLAAVQDYVTFKFNGADIKDVVRQIASATGSNIITEKTVTGKITLSLKDVYYERALELVSKTNGYVVRKIDNTYVIGPAQKLAEGFDIGLNRTYKLNYAEAESVSKIISGIFKKAEVPIETSVDERVNAVIVSGNQTALDKIDDLIKSIDVPVHQVMIEAKIVEITTGGERELGMKWYWGVGNDVSTENNANRVFRAQEFQRKRVDSDAYNGDMTLGAPFSFGDFFRLPLLFDATLAAAETTNNGKLLSNPKIMAMNGKEAEVNIGTQVIYSGGPTQPPQEKETGVILKITPRINDEGWITLDVEPTVSGVEWRELKGGDTYAYPAISQRKAKTTVKVKDGEEILIGGLIQQEESKAESKIPILGDVPLLKSLFNKKTGKSTSKELIILITPHVVQQLEG